ncbi:MULTISPECIES: DoxX family membrane protein [Flavobacteriales]|uniref:DoxX family membrane protein n=3 Tax=Flavobacteriales TaxID=200644 RepID=A0A9Q3UXT9_9FLAO|nr:MULTISPECIES: DoxX family membrane protein [Flavobacteriales]MBD3906614.1 DoxX family membrane protein [Chryseobacterium muglaense]MBQ0909687.1 DoxX family membrane protein [Flavobacterium erciyesense]MCC9036572.1 DoxX family membrane protein [Chryseobacterium muglaense]MCM2556245.1 DoxX family membrane protein [Chryseobacterium muglaense]QRE04911.1 DoxX family membrane protein [Flavobacterium psychrophilum]
MKYSNLIIRIGFGLLFVWGGLEKFFEGFLGGVGLQKGADILKSSGLSFLGDSGTFALVALLAFLELAAGILVLANKQLKYAYGFLAFIMLMALVLVHIPSGNWMNIMIHIALFTTLLGLALDHFSTSKSN